MYAYYYPAWWIRAGFQPVWASNLPTALLRIKEAVQGERSDELFYDELIRLAPSKEQADIIASIRDDERSHNRMFRQMYKAITGQEVSGGDSEPYEVVESYDSGIQKALMGELSAVEKYRSIWFGLPAGVYRDTVYGIILDELKHASKYNYLFTLNRTQH
ncbi:ferritin family protein [Paenibacillus beijingensis]|uniref:Rubrerythrin n=1 Tax=Paenibacillus beijingensis TaxID=1126833 RepID=A0A0D5NEQ9_9BACL|nr:ferritin-like domain-containing protein [Paenibacillus beijingensis]AJY73716.1 rubrerythrin [Paenibacillus beijingensis]